MFQVALVSLMVGTWLTGQYVWSYSRQRGHSIGLCRSMTTTVIALGLYVVLYLVPDVLPLGPGASLLGIGLIMIDVAVFMGAVMFSIWYGQREPIPFISDNHRPRT